MAILASTAGVARAATPIVTVGPTGSPTGNSATGTVGSGGQTDACLDQQHSGANPSAASPAGVLQIADSSCSTGAGSEPAGATTGAGASVSGPSGGGAGQSGGSSATAGPAGGSTSQTSTSSQTATVSRRTAGFSNASPTRGASSVSAAAARGLKIARVRYQLVRAKKSKHLRVRVTLRDRRGRLVRSAIVSISGLPGAKSTLAGPHFGFSNRKGQATFAVGVTRSMLGHRFLFRIKARTPSAHALKVGAVLVPKERAKRRAVPKVAAGSA